MVTEKAELPRLQKYLHEFEMAHGMFFFLTLSDQASTLRIKPRSLKLTIMIL